jgi:hypothetical protein
MRESIIKELKYISLNKQQKYTIVVGLEDVSGESAK